MPKNLLEHCPSQQIIKKPQKIVTCNQVNLEIALHEIYQLVMVVLIQATHNVAKCQNYRRLKLLPSDTKVMTLVNSNVQLL